MFTGLVESVGSIIEVVGLGPGRRFMIEAGGLAMGIVVGDSVAVSGCCLTVVENTDAKLAFEAGSETLSRTTLGELEPGCAVNLERSVRVGEPLGGHFVTGHIDGLGTLTERYDEGAWSKFWIDVSLGISRQLACKGSVAVDGVSLTLVDVEDLRFSVALIPHTLQVTTFGSLRVGDQVNIETDILAKYVERQMSGRNG